MRGIGLVLLLSVVTAECFVFMYWPLDAHDPTNVAILRDALRHVGLDSSGLVVLSLFYKMELVRTAYKATFILDGKKCFLKWRVNVIGTQAPRMPTCSNLSVGNGLEVPELRLPGRTRVVYPPVLRPNTVRPPSDVNSKSCRKCELTMEQGQVQKQGSGSKGSVQDQRQHQKVNIRIDDLTK